METISRKTRCLRDVIYYMTDQLQCFFRIATFFCPHLVYRFIGPGFDFIKHLLFIGRLQNET